MSKILTESVVNTQDLALHRDRRLGVCITCLLLLIAWNCGLLPAHAELGFDEQRLSLIDKQVEQAIAKREIPGCVVMIGRREGIAFSKAYGNRALQPTVEPMTLDTVFDLASLTKPIATATSIMLLVERGEVRLRDPVVTYLPEFAAHGKDEITVEHLLTHQGGLVPDNSLEDYQQGAEEAWKRIYNLELVSPVGERFIYTDVGFLVLGKIVERVSGQSLDKFVCENIYEPLGMKETGYLPNEALSARAATTEQRDGQWLRGVVHDPRSALLGGVAGHAGLYSTAHDLSIYARMMLSNGNTPSGRFFSPLTVGEMGRPRKIAGQLRGLGWDMGSKYSSNRGELFSNLAFGHGGFTGTAIWMDPKLNLFVIVLSNRVHPDGKGIVNPLAGRIGTIAASALRDGSNEMDSPTRSGGDVLLGIDVLERSGFAALKGRRVGLITNHTGTNREGKRTVDLLHRAEGVKLVSLFSPEHGLQGKLDQPEIDDARDEATGLSVYSLYGANRQPSIEHLQQIDTLVFDIQDIGTRFYTYLSTMGLAMEAAAKQKLRFVVLDRPNPIGGELVEGPVLDAGSESFVGYHTIPVRHGMTLGELAQMIKAEKQLDLELEVIPVENWRRGEYWDATGLLWINPSPNMRSLNEAVLYPGVGLLETTNVSVGRGTDTPFELLGAPWIEGQRLASKLNQAGLAGVRFLPIRFTPNASKFKDEVCEGVNVIVTDRARFRSVPVGLQIACTLRELYPADWQTKRFNRLLIDQKVFEAVERGVAAEGLRQLYADEFGEFLERRAKYLIYQQ